MVPKGGKSKLSVPHSHAYLDLDNDFMADLFITTIDNFEVWHGREEEGFHFSHMVFLPTGPRKYVGQTLFLDIGLTGEMNHLLPICFDETCMNSSILVNASQSHFDDLKVNFKDDENQQWGFVVPVKDNPYLSTITMRAGDFNMDGFPYAQFLIPFESFVRFNHPNLIFFPDSVETYWQHWPNKMASRKRFCWKTLSASHALRGERLRFCGRH